MQGAGVEADQPRARPARRRSSTGRRDASAWQQPAVLPEWTAGSPQPRSRRPGHSSRDAWVGASPREAGADALRRAWSESPGPPPRSRPTGRRSAPSPAAPRMRAPVPHAALRSPTRRGAPRPRRSTGCSPFTSRPSPASTWSASSRATDRRARGCARRGGRLLRRWPPRTWRASRIATRPMISRPSEVSRWGDVLGGETRALVRTSSP